MIVKIERSKGYGNITAPPSKSVSHRMLLAGAFSPQSVIKGIAFSKDITATLDCLKALGADIKQDGDTVTIGGLSLKNIHNNAVLNCNESGSTLRFLLPICMASGKSLTLTGSKRLFERPLSIYEDIAASNKIKWDKKENSITVKGSLTSGDYYIPGNISSQFITGLMYTLPFLDGDSTISVVGGYESKSYVNLTITTLKSFGINISEKDNTYYIKGGQCPKSTLLSVEGDYSNAAFLDALNLLGGQVTVSGLNPNSAQGDKIYKKMFVDMQNKKHLFDLSDCPDLAPVMIALATITGGARFTGTSRLKIKESDRGAAMADELLKFGVPISVEKDSITVHPSELKQPKEVLYGHNDHRIVMSLALLCTVTGGEIEGAEAVQKSYPDFFEDLKKIKIGLSINET